MKLIAKTVCTVFLGLPGRTTLHRVGTLNLAFGVTYVDGPTRTRTWDLVVISDALCQLSYEPGYGVAHRFSGGVAIRNMKSRPPRISTPTVREGPVGRLPNGRGTEKVDHPTI